MNRKLLNKIFITGFVILMAGLGLGLVSCGSANAEHNHDGAVANESTLYTCGMHPEVIQDGPGQCPICGMNLTPIDVGAGSSTDGDMSGTGVTIDPAIVQSIGVRYAQVESGPVEKIIRAAAHVDFDEDHFAVLSTRTDGWVEKLYVSSPGARVSEGDPLFDFYAPTLYSAQEEYLIARRMGDTTLANAAVERLRLLGVSDEIIEDIRVNGSRRAVTITSPMDGVVVSMGSSSAGGVMSGGGGMAGGMDMGGMSDSNSGMGGSVGSEIREGGHVGSGTDVFSIADLSSVWVYAHVYEDELAFARLGLPVVLELDYLPGQDFHGEIDFIYPYLDRQTRDIKFRMKFENPDVRLMPGMLGTVRIESRVAENGLLIPRESVIYSGDRRVVFAALPASKFAPIEVELGVIASDDMVHVISGLVDGQTIVTSAQFMLDSESRLKEALNKMLAGDSMQDNEMSMDDPADEDWVDLAPDDPNALFKCPMEEDRYYTSEDGECPVCGMFLQPHEPTASEDHHDEHAH